MISELTRSRLVVGLSQNSTPFYEKVVVTSVTPPRNMTRVSSALRAAVSVARHSKTRGARGWRAASPAVAGIALGDVSSPGMLMTSPDFGSARHPRGRGFASDAPGDAPSPSWRPGPGPEGFDPDDLLAPLRAKVEKQMAGLTEKTPQQVALDNALGEESGHEANEKTGEWNGPRGPEPTRFGDWERGGRCSDF